MRESRAGLAAIAVAMLTAASPGRADDWRPPVTRTMVEEQFVLFEPDYRRLKAERMDQLRASKTESLRLDGAFAAPAGFSSSFSDAQYLDRPELAGGQGDLLPDRRPAAQPGPRDPRRRGGPQAARRSIPGMPRRC